MVKKDKYKGEDSYKCEKCGFHYEKKKQAQNCEEHCTDYNSCDTQTIVNSLERKNKEI